MQDSLAQYSYLVYGSTEFNSTKAKVVRGQQATGFFLKARGHIYFITAKHAVTNYVKAGDSKVNYPDSFHVYAHYDDPFHYLSIPAIWSTDAASLKGGLKDPDQVCLDVTGKLKDMRVSAVQWSSVNNDFETSQNYRRIHLFGFPVKMNQIEGNVIQISPPYRFETSHFHIAENFLNQIGKDVGIDSARYEVRVTDTRITQAFGGFSGAPVFIQSEGKWKLLGTLVGINPLRNAVYVVRGIRLE